MFCNTILIWYFSTNSKFNAGYMPCASCAFILVIMLMTKFSRGVWYVDEKIMRRSDFVAGGVRDKKGKRSAGKAPEYWALRVYHSQNECIGTMEIEKIHRGDLKELYKKGHNVNNAFLKMNQQCTCLCQFRKKIIH